MTIMELEPCHCDEIEAGRVNYSLFRCSRHEAYRIGVAFFCVPGIGSPGISQVVVTILVQTSPFRRNDGRSSRTESNIRDWKYVFTALLLIFVCFCFVVVVVVFVCLFVCLFVPPPPPPLFVVAAAVVVAVVVVVVIFVWLVGWIKNNRLDCVVVIVVAVCLFVLCLLFVLFSQTGLAC